MKNSNVSPRTHRAQEMFALVEKYLASGLTAKKFCQNESITYSTFQWWLHEYRKEKNASTKPISKKFVTLLPPQSHGSPALWQNSYAIEYPNGVVLRLTGPVDVKVVSQLIHLQDQ